MMGRLIAVIALSNAICAPLMAADEWMLRVETSGRVCHVQPTTAAPLGKDLKGPFSTRKAACAEAKNQYDDSSSDPTKCWTYGQGTIDVCKKEGIDLPH
jgi:hypothetical protein